MDKSSPLEFRKPRSSDEFTFAFAQELAELVKNHPAPDTPIDYFFMRDEMSGEISTVSCTPREFAEAVADESPIGCKVVNFYKSMKPDGDPAGQLIIEGLARAAEKIAQHSDKLPD